MEPTGLSWPLAKGEGGVKAPFDCMYAIYLKHPNHGTKVAISEAEADHDEGFGWVRYNPAEPEDLDDETPVNSFVVKRRGRPPKQG